MGNFTKSVSIKEIEQVIDQMRGLYLGFFESVISDGVSGKTEFEVLLLNQDNSPVFSGELGARMRVDAIEEGSFVHIASAQMLSYGVLVAEYGSQSMKLELEEFTWESCALQLPYETPDLGALLLEWFEDYFGSARSGKTGFLNVLHFMSDPFTDVDALTWIEIDFGSAPTMAFWDLVNILHDQGYSSVRISQSPESE
ncbi:MAG: hypothetical protein AAGD04_15480 [Pseudomonadota bacterium]